MIELNGIKKAFGKQQVLNGIDLSISEPGIYSVLGPNGSGKTTLIKIFLGMVRPNDGTIKFEGQVVNKQNAYRRKITYLPQIARFPENLGVMELFDFLETLRGKPERKEVLFDLFGVDKFKNKTLRYLSGGMRQKVNLTACLMYDTPVVILDEPSVGLDPVALLALKKFIKQEKENGKIVLITTHIMKLVDDLADEIVFLLEGNMYFKGKKQLLFDQTETTDMEHAIANILKQHEAHE